MFKHILAAAAALALAAPVAAQAQTVPSYAYAAQNDQEIHGRVDSFDGAYGLSVRDDNGYIDNIALHDGTIINPTGLELQPGMVVSILGYNGGNAFDANEIDTPYTFDNAVPYYSGHPWNFYGSGIDLSFFFGNTGWWNGSRGVAYNDDRTRNVTVVHDITNVHETNVHNNGRPSNVTQPREQTPREQTPRYNTVTPRTNQTAPVSERTAPIAQPRSFAPVVAPRAGSSIGTPRTFQNAPPQRSTDRGNGGSHESAPARGRK